MWWRANNSRKAAVSPAAIRAISGASSATPAMQATQHDDAMHVVCRRDHYKGSFQRKKRSLALWLAALRATRGPEGNRHAASSHYRGLASRSPAFLRSGIPTKNLNAWEPIATLRVLRPRQTGIGKRALSVARALWPQW